MLDWGGREVQGVEQVQSQATHITQVLVHQFARAAVISSIPRPGLVNY